MPCVMMPSPQSCRQKEAAVVAVLRSKSQFGAEKQMPVCQAHCIISACVRKVFLQGQSRRKHLGLKQNVCN